MKKQLLITCLLLTVLAFGQKKEKVKGSKIVKSELKTIDNFESIELEDNIEVFLVKGNDCALEIEADDNLIPFIEYKINGNNLRVSTAKDISSYIKLYRDWETDRKSTRLNSSHRL